MSKGIIPAGAVPPVIVEKAWQEVGASFERFCLSQCPRSCARWARMGEPDG